MKITTKRNKSREEVTKSKNKKHTLVSMAIMAAALTGNAILASFLGGAPMLA